MHDFLVLLSASTAPCRSFFEPLRFQCSRKMGPTLVHLPNGQTLTVSPVFAGLSFKSNDLNVHHSVFPPGWTIIIESEDELDPQSSSENEAQPYVPRKRSHIHRYRSPTLHNDNLFISSISNPSNVDFKPATSPTRQIAMMLWATLYWYFHQVCTSSSLRIYLLTTNSASSQSSSSGKR